MRVEGAAYVEAVKLAEDGSGDVVVRLYEPLGARTSVRVTASFEHTSVTEVDLLERPYDSGSWDGARLPLRPFQIVTLRFRVPDRADASSVLRMLTANDH